MLYKVELQTNAGKSIRKVVDALDAEDALTVARKGEQNLKDGGSVVNFLPEELADARAVTNAWIGK